MFFVLGKKPYHNFSHFYNLSNGLILSTDDGWTQTDNIITKGYSANHCSFTCSGDKVTISYPYFRTFPLSYNNSSITNLFMLENKISNCIVSVNNNFQITTATMNNVINKTLYSKLRTDNDILEEIHNILLETFESFLISNTLPLKIFLTQGLDSTLAWAYLDTFTKQYEIVKGIKFHDSNFWLKNQQYIQNNYWSYTCSASWKDPCVLVTGGYGDPCFLRGASTARQVLAQRNIDIDTVLKESDYQYLSFKESMPYSNNTVKLSKTKFMINLTQNILNQYQFWHLDNTMYFTPFKNLSIAYLLLQVSDELLEQQVLNGEVQRMLIQRLAPEKLTTLQHQKNINMFTKKLLT